MKKKKIFLSLIVFIYKGIIPAIILMIDWKIAFWNIPGGWNIPEISMIAIANAFLLLFAIIIISSNVLEIIKWTKRVFLTFFVLSSSFGLYWMTKWDKRAFYGFLYVPFLILWILVGVSEEYYLSFKEELGEKESS